MINSINDLKTKRDLVHQIDWTMTPEKAVDMYLEWGAGWTRGNDFVRSGDDESIYFVIYEWESPAQVTLLRRSSREVEELAKIPVDEKLVTESIDEGGKRAGVGVYTPSEELKKWLAQAIDGPSPEYIN